jgi:hypothetical protein
MFVLRIFHLFSVIDPVLLGLLDISVIFLNLVNQLEWAKKTFIIIVKIAI